MSETPPTLTRAQLHELVHTFYADVRADTALGPVFDAAIGEHWAHHLERMVEFWSSLMLGSRGFSGNVYGKHMALEGVEPAHFERWMTHWHHHTRHFAPDDRLRLRQAAQTIGRSLFLGFFNRSAEFIADDDGRVVVATS
ncbi:group III truncated hemoglobin [Denitromonas sp.]|uniref:group III truncated hemoglobin n=1 Tax=Denitromonas sp. TaxID=2734609 RepID=UPI003A846D5A